MFNELQQWFAERTSSCGGTSCKTVTLTPDAHFSVYPAIIDDTTEKVFTLLAEIDIDCTEAKQKNIRKTIKRKTLAVLCKH